MADIQGRGGDLAQAESAKPEVMAAEGQQAPEAPSMLSGAAGALGSRLLQRKIASRLARKSSAAGMAADPGEAIARADAGSGAAVDEGVRGKVERTTGQSLGDVRVHHGAPSNEAAAAVGARAYTVGKDIHFGQGEYQPGTPGGDHLIAHELAHTVQQSSSNASNASSAGNVASAGGAGHQAKLEVSQPGDSAEVEADRVADAAVGNASGAVSVTQTASTVAREALPGNPNNLTNNAGNQTTAHATPTINDAINHQQPPPAGTQAATKNVKPVATATAPFQVGPDVCPVTSRIYEEGPAVSPAPSGFSTITTINGTDLAPQIEHVADNGIFINNQPSPNDVQQMGIGDCYFLALTMSIAQRDPAKIKSMMTPDGQGGASVTFFKKQVTQPNWLAGLFGAGPRVEYVPVTIGVNNQLSYNLNITAPLGSGQRVGNGQPGGFALHGAQLRCADQPKNSAWWSKVDASTLEVHRRDTFECARWAPLMEKAFARFSELHGQYGGSQGAAGGESTGPNGYKNIDGGWSHNAMFVYYGAAADQHGANTGNAQQQATNWAPGSQALAANPAAVDQLLLLAGRGAQAAGQTSPIVTATSMVHLLIPRLQTAINAAQADPDWANLTPATQTNIMNVNNAIAAFNTTPVTPKPAKDAARANIGTQSSTAVLPGNAPELFQAARSRPIKNMLELLLDLKNIGVDQSRGQRNIYGDHVYSVVGANFTNTAGVPVPLQSVPSAMRPPLFPQVDAFVSTVRLRNPHHTNEPDAQGNNTPSNAGDGAPSGAAADGIFTMSVDQFFRNYTSVESGVFPRT